MNRMKKPWNFNDFIFSLSALGREHERNLKILHDFTMKVVSNISPIIFIFHKQ